MRSLNAREVLFAQEIVKGATGRDAYKAAGYKLTNDNTMDVCASQLLRRPKVAAYIQELQGRAATRAEISVVYLTEKVLALAKSAEDIPQNPAAIQAALASYMGAAKLNGLIIDRTINERKDTVDLTRAELMDLIRQRRGLGSGDAQSNGRGGEPDRVHRVELLPIPDRKAS
jgi:phage terminase small subunit